jgi:hypothetical protein
MNRAGLPTILPLSGLALAVFVVLASPLAAAAAPEGPVATVLVEISSDEGTLSVAQAFSILGGGAGTWTVPLLLPESGAQPRMIEKIGDAPGLEIQVRGGATAKVRDGAVVVSGTPGMSGDFGVEIHFQVPVKDAHLVLGATTSLALVRVQVIHRGGPYALQVRPLAPFAYREESEGDGTWRYQDMLEPLPAGQRLRVAVGRLPSATGPYRTAGLALLLLVATGTAVLLVRRRAG